MISNEARWFYEGYLPSSIEKLKNSMFHSRAEIRSDYYLLTKGCDDMQIDSTSFVHALVYSFSFYKESSRQILQFCP